MSVKWDEIIRLSKQYDDKNFLMEYLLWGSRFIESLDKTSFITDDFQRLFIVGMGGSGIVGDIIRDYLIWNKDIAVDVVKNSKLPKYIDEDDFLIGISFSGDTIETISAVQEALEKGIRILVITTGGKLLEISKEKKFPVILVKKALAPRAGLPQLLGATLKAIVSDKDLLSQYVMIGKTLEKKGFEYGLENEMNKAFKLAYHMWGRLPIFYSNIRYYSLLHRAKSSINENAKINAYYTVFPEGFHNEVEAYEELTDPSILPIIFRDEDDEIEYLIKHLEKLDIEFITIDLKGENNLEKILLNILMIDVASIYLSYLRRKNPLETNIINKIKKWR